ncbi:MAG: HAD family hydrolase [Verrucomicrobiales bacterium]
MINAILFDLDNTLIDRNAALRASLQQEVSDRDHQARLIEIDQGGGGNREPFFTLWTSLTGKLMCQQFFAQMLSRNIKPDEDLLKVLETLAQRFKVGIITNGGGTTQREKLKASRLDQVIPSQWIWISSEVGIDKPHCDIYLLACNSMNENPRHCLFLGDDTGEVKGAEAAGLRARCVDHPLNGPRLGTILAEEGML